MEEERERTWCLEEEHNKHETMEMTAQVRMLPSLSTTIQQQQNRRLSRVYESTVKGVRRVRPGVHVQVAPFPMS